MGETHHSICFHFFTREYENQLIFAYYVFLPGIIPLKVFSSVPKIES